MHMHLRTYFNMPLVHIENGAGYMRLIGPRLGPYSSSNTLVIVKKLLDGILAS